MPVNLEAQANQYLATQQLARQYVPSFFNTSDVQLTGKGGKTGALREDRNPIHAPQSRDERPRDIDPYRKKIETKDTTYTQIPLFALSSYSLACVERQPLLDTFRACDFARSHAGHTARIRVTAHALLASRDRPKVDATGKSHTFPLNVVPTYRVDVVNIGDDASDVMENLLTSQSNPTLLSLARNHYGNAYLQLFTDNVPKTLMRVADAFRDGGWMVDANKLNGYLAGLDLYALVCERSEAWQETMCDEIRPLIDACADGCPQDAQHQHALVDVLHRLESYGVPLESYRELYRTLEAKFDPDYMKGLCKENLNIMLSNLMSTLDADKDKLAKFVADPKVPVDASYNLDQRAIVTSEEPLALVQSVAGSGKSRSIIGRVKYMMDCGVAPSDITVISFTNAAADHITDIMAKDGREIHSMTIDALVSAIYLHNFPEQEISTTMTVMNCLDVYFPRDSVAVGLREGIRAVMNNVEGAFTRLNLFVEAHLDRVMEMLATLHQVTLDLAVVLCYQLIDRLDQPDSLVTKHVIIDEVQDTSIFQFIYVLKYAHKYRTSLLLIGDSSQTLFEFRFANPRALNVMEASDVFATYKLQTNYRSCQEILDLANKMLGNIEANHFAQLQLDSNELRLPTAATFKDKVRMRYVRVKSQVEMRRNLDNYARMYLKPYVDECLARGEQVTLLAYYRADVEALNAAMKALYPQLNVINISPKQPFEVTVLTTFAKRYWNDVRCLSVDNIVHDTLMLIVSNLSDLLFKPDQAKRQAALDFVNAWSKVATDAMLPYVQAYKQGTIGADEVREALQRQMFAYEAKENIARQNVKSHQNAKMKSVENTRDAHILTSTIHSAKGLEWDNVVVLYHDKAPMPEQEKRLYYVAMTRAMKSEYILAFDSRATSTIQAYYDSVVARLNASAVDV